MGNSLLTLWLPQDQTSQYGKENTPSPEPDPLPNHPPSLSQRLQLTKHCHLHRHSHLDPFPHLSPPLRCQYSHLSPSHPIRLNCHLSPETSVTLNPNNSIFLLGGPETPSIGWSELPVAQHKDLYHSLLQEAHGQYVKE